MFPGPIFTIFGQGVYLYGICMALGIIGCFVFLMWAFAHENFNEQASDVILFVGVFATAIGIFFAAVFQALYNYIANPSAGFHLDGSGMTFFGGLVGGVVSYLTIYNLYVFVVAPKSKWKWLQNTANAGLTDALPMIPIGIAFAHSFGRLGCFFAGCCYGMESHAWYAIKFETTATTVVPTNLFECIFLAILVVIMAILFYKFKFQYNLGLYAVSYGVWRFIIEFIRDDYRGEFVGGITPSQFWSIVMVAAGIGYFFLHKYVLCRFRKYPQKQAPVATKEE